MGDKINVDPKMLTWAVVRAGFDLAEFTKKDPNFKKWINEGKNPTVKQLEKFSKKVHIPFGYLFLYKPPVENIPIPFFRTNGNQTEKISLNVYDTILLIQQRQNWLRDYLKDNGFKKLPFVGRFNLSNGVTAIVNDIRQTLGLTENWASKLGNWKEAQKHLVQTIENNGIIVNFNGVVENNSSRKIPVDECRGFVLVDDIAPFMFINNTDSKSAQMFTIVHELAHIWTGHSAGFDFRKLQPSDDPIEILCDRVAAEFLVPENALNEKYNLNPNIVSASSYFKVSEIVIARRFLDTGKLTQTEFLKFYEEYINREFIKKESKASGGNFYATTKKRLSVTFATHINNAVKTGNLLYRDACKLTSLKGDTFQTFFSKHI